MVISVLNTNKRKFTRAGMHEYWGERSSFNMIYMSIILRSGQNHWLESVIITLFVFGSDAPFQSMFHNLYGINCPSHVPPAASGTIKTEITVTVWKNNSIVPSLAI